jgi:hypothetical protein
VAARGVPDRDDPVERQLRRRSRTGPASASTAAADVVEGRGPPTAPAHPAVLDVPRREPGRGEVRGQRAAEVEVVGVPPEPAVDDDHDAARRPRGQRQLTEPLRPRRVRDGDGHAADPRRAVVAAACQQGDIADAQRPQCHPLTSRDRPSGPSARRARPGPRPRRWRPAAPPAPAARPAPRPR